MRKIGFFNYISFFAGSAILGILFSTGLMFITKPLPAEKVNLPVISFNNVQLFKSNIETKINPFAGPLADLFAPPKPILPEMPAVPETPAEPVIPENERIFVMGILPPDTCILRKGGQVITVRSGKKSEFGEIGKITSEGVYVDGKLYEMQTFNIMSGSGYENMSDETKDNN